MSLIMSQWMPPDRLILKTAICPISGYRRRGPSVVLSGPQTAQPTFVALAVGTGGEILTFKVTVTDEDESESTDRVSIEVVREDNCHIDPNKLEPGICGCGIADVDTDGDGTPDCNDNCPDDPGKIEPGSCGCGIADVDTDGEGTLDCNDSCDDDPNKTQPGICGCNVQDIDTDMVKPVRSSMGISSHFTWWMA